MFILRYLFTKELLFWKGIARDCERSGVYCCRLCAALGEQDICMACQVFLADENQYEWFKNAVRGEPPLTMKDLSEEELETRFSTMNHYYPTLNQDIMPRPHGVPNYDGNIDWARKLDLYSKLDDPFNDIAELAAQWHCTMATISPIIL